MKKSLLALALAVVLFAACGVNGPAGATQAPEVGDVCSKSEESAAAAKTNTINGWLMPSGPSVCEDQDRLGAFVSSMTQQSDAIKASLENDPMTQLEMDEQSQALRDLWDRALNYVLGSIQFEMSEEKFAELMAAQELWLAERDAAAEEAGKAVEGGSLYTLTVNMEAARLTEERVSELYEMQK